MKIVSVVLFVWSWPAIAAPLMPLELFRAALNHSPEIQVAKQQVEQARLTVNSARAQFWPSLDLTADHGIFDSIPKVDVTPAYSATTLALTETIYNNGESLKNLEIAKLREQIAQSNLNKVQNKVVLDVAKNLHAYSFAVRKEEIAKRAARELTTFLKFVTDQFHQGLKTQKDFLRFKTKSQRSILDAARAETDRMKVFGNLQQVVGVPIEIQPLARPLTQETKATTTFKATETYEGVQYDLKRQIADLQIEIMRRRTWPEINLTAAGTYGSSRYIDTGESFTDNAITTWKAIVGLKWNIFDWGVRSNNHAIEQSKAIEVEAQDRLVLLGIQNDIEKLKADWKEAVQSRELTKDLEKDEKSNYRILEREYRNGRLGYLDYVDALTNLNDAELRSLQSDFDLSNFYLTILYYKGQLYETLVKK